MISNLEFYFRPNDQLSVKAEGRSVFPPPLTLLRNLPVDLLTEMKKYIKGEKDRRFRKLGEGEHPIY